MNIGLFFEGTGRGVAGKMTNVTRLRDLCVDDAKYDVIHFNNGLHSLDTPTDACCAPRSNHQVPRRLERPPN
ncbi:MAG: hypothetical protein IKO55_02645 [Kiritimatiellae bacterium]|nr:hypothetical protein [Kiritimatiellia bacterium]